MSQADLLSNKQLTLQIWPGKQNLQHSVISMLNIIHLQRYIGGEVDLRTLQVIGIGPRDSANGSFSALPADPRTGKPLNDGVPIEHQIPK